MTSNTEVYFQIRREKTTIFCDCKENHTVRVLKEILQPLVHRAPEDQQLYHGDKLLASDKQRLIDAGFDAPSAKPHQPANLTLVLRGANGEFEKRNVMEYSTPPDMPEVVKKAVEDVQNQGDLQNGAAGKR